MTLSLPLAAMPGIADVASHSASSGPLASVPEETTTFSRKGARDRATASDSGGIPCRFRGTSHPAPQSMSTTTSPRAAS